MIGAAMRIVKVGVLAPTNKGIPLGVQGESRATEVEFDTRPWFREYSSGTVSAVARRYGDPAPYPLSLDVSEGTAVWTVSDTDTAKAGEGAVELTMTSGGARVRSLKFKTLVTASLTDAPVDDDAWYGWLDKAVVKVDETVQSAQRKMAEVDAEWTGIKADVAEKVEECGNVAAKAADDAHHAKVDAQATAKALESAEGSVAKAEAAATRAEDAAEQAYGAAGQASVSAGNASDAASEARDASAQAAGWADRSENSATRAAASETNAAASASSAAVSAEHATAQKVAAENAKDAAESFKAGAEAAKGEAATSASNAATSATAAAKSASDAAASVGAINVISPLHVNSNRPAVSVSEFALAIGRDAKADSADGVAIGPNAHAVASAVALGTGSVAKINGTISVGNDDTKRRIMNVASPTGQFDASNKKYTDDNDAKTLSEAKKYTDDNTTNALIGTASGKLLHVEDAWPSKPLGLTIDGACKQDGTPSPENPVPITVVENPVLKVTGADTSSAGTSLPVTLPAEHPYLAALPDGTHDEIVIDKYGNASLVARVQKVDMSNLPAPSKITALDSGLTRYEYWNFIKPSSRQDSAALAPAFENVIKYMFSKQGMYTSTTYIVVGATEDPTEALRAGGYIYTTLANPITYPLGKLDIPILPETISNVWVDAELTTDMSMTYKQDVNIVIDDLTAQIAALKGTNDIVQGDSTASPDDAIGVPDNDVNAV